MLGTVEDKAEVAWGLWRRSDRGLWPAETHPENY